MSIGDGGAALVTSYFLIKLIHILSSTLLFGTGLGTAFYMWRAHRSGDVRVLMVVSKNVVLADWIFTLPTVIIQPVTGWLMIEQLGLPVSTPWIMWSIALYLLIGCCWLPVVWIQIKVAQHSAWLFNSQRSLDNRIQRLMRWWYTLGWPAFIGVIIVFYLMVVKPAI